MREKFPSVQENYTSAAIDAIDKYQVWGHTYDYEVMWWLYGEVLDAYVKGFLPLYNATFSENRADNVALIWSQCCDNSKKSLKKKRRFCICIDTL